MTATNPTKSDCPSCSSVYAYDQENGTRRCPECGTEWDPRNPPAPRPVGRQLGEPLPDEDKLIERVDELGSYDTVLTVRHDDGGSLNWRDDRYTYHTSTPHTVDEAAAAAYNHFTDDIHSEVSKVEVVDTIDDPPAPVIELVEDVEPESDVEPSESDQVLAAAYLATLTGTGVTLDGGQRAVLLDFPDDDHARVQLADGSTAVVEFNDIIAAGNPPDEADMPGVEIDDATAEMFGGAALILACLVIEAGIASIEGDGETAHLIEAPTGWFPPDEDAIPLMEQAGAGAVAMLIQTFALPRAELQAMVANVRQAITDTTTTEV